SSSSNQVDSGRTGRARQCNSTPRDLTMTRPSVSSTGCAKRRTEPSLAIRSEVRYRRYAPEQIVTAQVIRRFRDLDLNGPFITHRSLLATSSAIGEPTAVHQPP